MECLKFCGTSIILISLLFSEISMAITGSVILSNNRDAIDGKKDVWVYLLIQTILKYLVSLGFGNDRNNDKNSNTTNIIGYANTGIAIWGIVIYFNINNNIKNDYIVNYPSLWTFIEILAIYHIVLFCLTGFIIIMVILIKCFSKEKIDISNV